MRGRAWRSNEWRTFARCGPGTPDSHQVQATSPIDLKLFATVFVTVFLAELGDKTQLAQRAIALHDVAYRRTHTDPALLNRDRAVAFVQSQNHQPPGLDQRTTLSLDDAVEIDVAVHREASVSFASGTSSRFSCLPTVRRRDHTGGALSISQSIQQLKVIENRRL